MPPHMALPRWHAGALPAISFGSGAAGLAFEMVWLHRAGLVFGNSVWAAAIVLSSFMAGLALGSVAVARAAGRIRRPLRLYAAAEITVAVAGIALTFALPHVNSRLRPLFDIAAGSGSLNLIRLGAAFALLLVPTTAMGATLPLLVAATPGGGQHTGRSFGRIYGWNTLGAVAGVLVTETVLIDRVGVSGAAAIAGTLDLVVAALAAALSDREGVAPVPESAPTFGFPSTVRLPLVCAFLSGGLFLALEVIWFRCIGMYVLSTTLTMSVMLAVVLGGIALGGLAASRQLTHGQPQPDTLPALALLSGASVAWSYLAFQTGTAGAQVGDMTRLLWFAAILTGPTAFLSGCFLTLLADRVGRDLIAPARAVGALAVSNTAGAALGPPLAAFALLPTLGMEHSLLLLAIGYAAIAMLTVDRTRGIVSVARSPRVVGTASAFVIALVVLAPRNNAVAFARAADAYSADGSTVVATWEGAAETIFVMQQRWLGQPVYNRLVTNGFSMSGTTIPAMRYMRYFAYWPMLLRQSPVRRALVVCYGVGVTVAAALDLPSLASLDVVEISRDVVAASDVIYPPGARPLDDPRVRLHLEDGRFFLQTSNERFDLITGEPPPPRTPGAVNIYTREYFQLIYDHLSDGGVTTYWVPVARPDPGTDVSTIIRAFCDVFEDCSLWNGTPSDLMLVGTRHAIGPVTETEFASAWRNPTLSARLTEVGFEAPEEIGATFIGDAPYLRQLTAGAPPLTDDFPQRLRPVLSRPSLSDPRYRSDPSVMALFEQVIDPARAQRAFADSPFIRQLWPAALRERTLPWFDVQRRVNGVLWEGSAPLRHIEELHAVLTTTTLQTLPLWMLGSDVVKQRIAEQSGEHSAATEYVRGIGALAKRDYLGAAAHLGESERLGLKGATVRPLQVYAMCLAGDLRTARLLARGLDPSDSDTRHFAEWIERTFPD
jgi:predicted membrane-bound spermidine synthase